ncbi:MAG: proton-conducting transporter membrane subunit [Candidatus Omnitrophica bacterium]|nr:proton-conducting transporter membrane subunit [Candidatus Omnitrophota bacterium]
MFFLFIFIPILSVIILNFPFFRNFMKKISAWVGLSFSLGQVLCVLFPRYSFWNRPALFIENLFGLHLAADKISFLMLVTIGIVVFVVLLVARQVIEDRDKRFNFVNLVLIIIAGMNGVVLAGDIFSLYIFLEITAVTSFILISFHKKRDALEGTFKYIILSAVATMFILSAIALIVFVTGSTSFSAVQKALISSPHTGIINFAIAIFLSGLFIKGGLVPFHGWLADAYSSAGRAVSILLAGIATKVLGAYTLIRVVWFVFYFDRNINNVLLLVGAVSIIVGALMALSQNDFKRMLAYSSISQVGYIILSLGCGSLLGVVGALFHIFNHAIFKSLLFVDSTILEVATGTRNMDKLGGVASKMPITATTSTLACLSAAGIPPFAGFWSKFIIILALWLSGNYIYAVIAVLASVLTLGYLLAMQRRVFWGELAAGLENIKEANLGLLIPSLLLTILIVGVGLFFPLILKIFVG